MNRYRTLLSGLISLMVSATAVAQQPLANAASTSWKAFSTTAMAITGDIVMSPDSITFANGDSLKLQIVDSAASTGQTLYKVLGRRNPTLLNGNHLCGTQAVNYLLTEPIQMFANQRDLQLSVYLYPDVLRLKDLPLKDQSDPMRSLCAIYTYLSAS